MKFINFKNFQIQETPMTQKQWQNIMGNNPSKFKGENNPVEMISWDDCKEFIQKLNDSQKEYIYSALFGIVNYNQ